MPSKHNLDNSEKMKGANVTGKNRYNCRLPVQIECPERGQQWKGHTKTLGLDGLFIERATCFLIDSTVKLHLIESDSILEFSGKIRSIEKNGSDIQFDTLTPSQQQVIENILHPDWQCGELLDCLLVVSRHISMQTLSDVVRVTTLLEKHHKPSIDKTTE